MKKTINLVSVVIVTRNRKKDLIECIDSYLKSSYKPIEIVVIDNNSVSKVESWLPKKYSKVRLISLNENVGAAEGRNIGYKEARGNYILFTDDDAYAGRDMIGHLVSVFRNNNKVGIVQPLVYDKQNKNLLQGAGHDINLLSGRIKAWGDKEEDVGQYEGLREVPMCGCVWMVKREVFNKIGLYDEDYFIPYEDSDFSIRARKAGFKLYCYSKAKTWHQGIKSTFVHPRLELLGITSSERAFRTARNKMIFMRKHSPFPVNIFFFFILFPVYIFLQTIIIFTTLKLDVLWKYCLGVISGIKYALSYKKTLPLILCALLIVVASYLTVRMSLDFALFGDDWVGLYIVKYNYGQGYLYDYTKLRGIIGPYSVPFHLIGVINYFWDYNPAPYFLIAFVFRTMMCLGLAYLIYKITKNLLSGTITGILAAVNPTGLETTNWGAWNMATYLAVFLFSISLWFFISSRTIYRKYFLALLFLTLSIITFPQRMQIASVFLLLIDFFWLVKNLSRKKFIIWLARTIPIIAVMLFLNYYHAFGGVGDRNYFISETLANIKLVKPYFWVNLVTSFSNSIIPYSVWTSPSVNTLMGHVIGSTIGPKKKLIFLIYALLSLVVAFFLKKSRKKFIVVSLLLGTMWTYYLKMIFNDPLHTFNSINSIFATFLGGYVLIWLLTGLIINIKSRHVLNYFEIFSWFFIFASISWVRSNFQILPTYFRYILVPGVWMPLFTGFIFSKINVTGKKLLFFSFVLLLAMLYYNSSYSFLKELYPVRNAKIYDKLWGQLIKEMSNFKPNERYAVFYFEGPGGLVYNTLVFGFVPKVAILYGIPESEAYKLPVFVDNYQNLQQVVTGDDFTKAFAKNPERLTEDRIYAFAVSEEGLVNIKEKTITRLKKDGSLLAQ